MTLIRDDDEERRVRIDRMIDDLGRTRERVTRQIAHATQIITHATSRIRHVETTLKRLKHQASRTHL